MADPKEPRGRYGARRQAEAARRQAEAVRTEAGAIRSVADRRLPFWRAQAIVAAALVLDLSLPEKLTLGPRWLLPTVEGLLVVGLVLAYDRPDLKHAKLRRQFAIGLIGLVSAVNMFSLILLVHYLLRGGKPHGGHALILAGVVLWVTNVLLFALWYWELDRGGPTRRMLEPDTLPDFLFPQMTEHKHAPEDWSPGLIDYLYLSFTNATAFSPTDTMPMTAIAKILMTVQSLASLVTIGLVVARAVNILSGS
jgi:uncharacterized membrane protein